MAATAEGGGRVRLGETPLRAERGARDATGPVQLTIRPERVGIEPAETTGENRVPATIERFVYLGSTTQVFIRLASGDPVQALVTNAGDVEDHDVGSRVAAHLAPDGLRVPTRRGRRVLSRAGRGPSARSATRRTRAARGRS